jgi:hypothetical protein
MRILEDLLMNHLWPRLRWPLTLAGLTLLPFLWVALAWVGPQPSPQFRSVRDLQAWAERRGLYCCSDRKDGRVTAGLALSTRPLSWEQVSGIAKEPGAHWDGVVWAVDVTPQVEGMSEPPWQGECRRWGRILVTGDCRLLDRIESEEN